MILAAMQVGGYRGSRSSLRSLFPHPHLAPPSGSCNLPPSSLQLDQRVFVPCAVCLLPSAMEWGAQHPPPWAEPSPRLPAGFEAMSGHGRSVRETCLWLTSDGTGPPDGKLKVRQGDGHAAGKALGGSQGGPDVSADGMLSPCHLPSCPGTARGFARDLRSWDSGLIAQHRSEILGTTRMSFI